MKSIHIARQKALPRRTLLKGLGVGFALPWLDAMAPAFGASGEDEQSPHRMLGICNNLGFIPDNFFPKEAGRGYTMSPYLKHLEAYRDDFTVFSGVRHPGVDAGHPADNCFLTAAPHPSSGGFRNTISLDQYLAERIGHLTRFPSLTSLEPESSRTRPSRSVTVAPRRDERTMDRTCTVPARTRRGTRHHGPSR